MKTFIYYLLILFAFVACQEENLEGKAEPINPERNEATIGAEGGTISIKTETDFRLSSLFVSVGGVEVDTLINVYNDSIRDFPQVLAGDWFRVEHRTKEVYFEIEPNESELIRELSLAIQRGDAGAYITVTQTAD